MDDAMRRMRSEFHRSMGSLTAWLRERIAADREPVAMPGWHSDYCVEWDEIEDGRCAWCNEVEDPNNIDHHPRSERDIHRCDVLGDMLTDLERISERSSDPDARMHARNIMGTMALFWITEDELDDKMDEWGNADG